ncbi:hypothetical protein HYX04_00435 [Candidatus Woesearchaeota archaeon]|nr:hypothetical protein [Candidatus Woesearchaeota archaeon]
MGKRYFYGLGILMLVLIFACTPQQPEQPVSNMPVPEAGNEKLVEKIAVEESKLTIVSPSDGELIKSSKVAVSVGAENFNIVPVGEPVRENEGHFHVWLDSEKKLGPQTSFTFENVVSGKHSIVAELVKSDHSSLSPRVTKTMTINVESDYVPPKVEPQQGVAEFTVEADDNGFYPNKIQAKISDTVKINFKFKDNSIYFKRPLPGYKL